MWKRKFLLPCKIRLQTGLVLGPLDFAGGALQISIITVTFCWDKLWKSKFMAFEKPGKLEDCFCHTFVATLVML